MRSFDGIDLPAVESIAALSNLLVRCAERNKRELGTSDRTKLSGNRNVPFKTLFPSALKLILNEETLWLLHLLQKANGDHPELLILYAEVKRRW